MRYSRQELYEDIGKAGQKRLRNSKAAIIGIGALGTVCSELLARAGIGSLALIDRDVVELSNLQRQALFAENDIGMPKAIAAKNALNRINSDVEITANVEDLDYRNIGKLVKGDVILDCTDNLETRFLLNEHCAKNRIRWVHAAAVKDHGNVMCITPGIGGKPCFKCIFGDAESHETCDTAGVLNTITNAIASIQATQAIKMLLNKEHSNELIRFNIWNNELENIKVRKNKSCSVCSGKYEYINGKKGIGIARLCGQNSYQIRGKDADLKDIAKRLHRLGEVKSNSYCINFRGMTIFRDGRALIKARDEKEAKSIYARYIGN